MIEKGLVKVMLPRMDVTEEPRKNFVRKPPKVLFVAQDSSSDDEDVDDSEEN